MHKHILLTVNFLNIRTPKKICCNHHKSWTRWLFLRVNASKRCIGNSKQCRPWSDCCSRSSLIWVCTVCPDLSVWKLRKITVSTALVQEIQTLFRLLFIFHIWTGRSCNWTFLAFLWSVWGRSSSLSSLHLSTASVRTIAISVNSYRTDYE